MLWNPYRDVHILAWQGALGLLLAIVLGALVLILLRAPEPSWQGLGRLPALPLPAPASRPDSGIYQPPPAAPSPDPARVADRALATISSEPPAADQTVAPAPAPASAVATEPPAGPVAPAAAPTSSQGGPPPAPPVGGQATVKASPPLPAAPPPHLSLPPPVPVQPPALPVVSKLPPAPKL
jgi:collagen type IV alpha